MTTARNDPCPCGSGRKFKRCCGNRDGDPDRAVYTDDQARSALHKLAAFATSDEFEGRMEAVKQLFFGETEIDEEMLEELGERTSALENMTFFLIIEYAGEGDETMLETFLRRRGGSLEAGQMRFLLDLRETHVSLYEVQAVLPERGVRLLDLWQGGEVEIADREVSRNAAPWDVFGARLMQRPDGHWVIQGEVYELHRGHKEQLLESIHRIESAARAESPSTAALVVGRTMGLLLHRASMADVLSDLEFTVQEGEEPSRTVTVFDVRDRAALTEGLGACEELEVIPGGWTWVAPGGPLELPLGLIWIEGDLLELETGSREEAERGRALLESLAGSAISFRLEKVGGELEDEDLDGDELEGEEDPCEDSEEARRERLASKERFYRGWLDSGIPALGDRTPRQISRSPAERHRLVELLKTIENWEAREARHGELLLDTEWMWRELGIERPGG